MWMAMAAMKMLIVIVVASALVFIVIICRFREFIISLSGRKIPDTSFDN
jgi:hypothetical protein